MSTRLKVLDEVTCPIFLSQAVANFTNWVKVRMIAVRIKLFVSRHFSGTVYFIKK